MEKKNDLHPSCIVMVPSPGLSHLIPLVEFAKRFIHQNHDFHFKFLVPTLGPPSNSMISILKTLPSPNTAFTILPQVNAQDLSDNKSSLPATLMQLTVKHSLPSIHESLTSLSSTYHIVALVFSIFSTDVLDLAKEFNLLSYVFIASGAIFLSFSLHLPQIDQSVSPDSDSLDLTQSVNIPGCDLPFQVRDFPEPIHHQRSSEGYKTFVGVCKGHSLVDGAIVNTYKDLESDTIAAIEHRESNRITSPFVYPIGPIIQNESSNEANKIECLTWLENQPPKSVLYISFGSGGTLSQEQLDELAYGLELSGHKFLWVVRAPSKFGGSAYLVGQKEDPLKYLPSGFLDRTRGRGLVVPSWAPQIEVLGRGSTGGFLTHCGWNSVLESIVHGVPLIAWPLFAEQRMNAKFLKDALKVALRPKIDEEIGIVKREEIADVIKRIMEGDEGLEMQKRMKELSDAASVAISENGSSRNAISSLAQKWRNV